MSLKKVYKNVKFHNPFLLLFLFLSSFALVFFATWIINSYIITGLTSFILSLFLSIIYFYFGYKYIIIKRDFYFYQDRFEYNDNCIHYNSIKSYKIIWADGAHLKMKLKNNKLIFISSNSNLYYAQPFISVCKRLDKYLSNTNGVVKRKPFFESKFGYYMAIVLTITVIGIIIYEIITGFNVKISKLVLMLVGLSGVWSQVNYKRKK